MGLFCGDFHMETVLWSSSKDSMCHILMTITSGVDTIRRVYTKTRWYPWYPLHLETWYPLVPVKYSDFIQKHVGTRGTHYIPSPPPTHTLSRRVYTKTRVYP